MRNSKAKKLRKQTYKEFSQKEIRYANFETGERVCTGLRGIYLKRKKEVKEDV